MHLISEIHLKGLLMLNSHRKIWAIERSEFWFSNLFRTIDDPENAEEWRRHFRLNASSFKSLVELVRPRLEKRDTQFRKAICIEKRVAIGLWRLTTGNSYRTIAQSFGVGISSAHLVTHKLTAELARVAPDFIKFPSTPLETGEAIVRFKNDANCCIPQVVGAIDGTHIRIKAPAVPSKADYYSRNKCYTVVTQAVVGDKLKFIDVATGYPGSNHDSGVLRTTALFQQAQAGNILNEPEKVVEGYKIKPILLGDGAYPLSPWLVKPYPHRAPLSNSQRKFNRKLSSARVTVEQAFGILKARFRILLTRIDCRIDNVSNTILASCVLHNICQENSDHYEDLDGVLDTLLQNEVVYRRMARRVVRPVPDGKQTRDFLQTYIDNNF